MGRRLTGWLGHPTEAELAAQARGLAWLFAAATSLALVGLVLPHGDTDVWGVLGACLPGYPAAAYLSWVGGGIRPWVPPVALLAGCSGVVVAAGFADHAGMSAAVAGCLVVGAVYAGQHFPGFVARLEVVSAVTVYGVELIVTGSRDAAPVWLFTAAAAAAGAALAGSVTAHLRAMAATDGLTGLPNRASFLEEVGRELDQARRTGKPLCLVAIDLDGFKEINDTFGHQRGDAVLVEAARAWQGQVRPRDRLGRLGGDEFALLLPDTTMEQARMVLDRLARAGSAPCSAGVAAAAVGDTPHALLHRADVDLYTVKRAKRSRRRPRPAGLH